MSKIELFLGTNEPLAANTPVIKVGTKVSLDGKYSVFKVGTEVPLSLTKVPLAVIFPKPGIKVSLNLGIS